MSGEQVQLVRIQRRVPEYGWTTQKVFHLLNFVVNTSKHESYIRLCCLSIVALVLPLLSPVVCSSCRRLRFPTGRTNPIPSCKHQLFVIPCIRVFARLATLTPLCHRAIPWSPQVLSAISLDIPGILFFTTYTLLVLFWAEIYHQVGVGGAS